MQVVLGFILLVALTTVVKLGVRRLFRGPPSTSRPEVKTNRPEVKTNQAEVKTKRPKRR
jgi:hypothetical protein